MSRFLVVSGREIHHQIADCCTFEFEDAVVDALEADLLRPGGTGNTEASPTASYDAVFLFANDFKKLAELSQLATRAGIKAKTRCGYVFGAYLSDARRLMNPLLKKVSARYKAIAAFDTLFLGIEDFAGAIGTGLGVRAHYSAMAVDMLKLGGAVQDRPIAVNGIGRQQRDIATLLADSFNRPGSPHLYFHTNFMRITGLADWERYRAMLWQILRQSRLSMAFDQRHYDPFGRAELSYVGPRWFESLGAGSVIVGKAPQTANLNSVLDWPDATIDLPEEPRDAVDMIVDLVEDRQRTDEISARNLANMYAKHDWRYRIADMLTVLGEARPARLDDQLATLAQRAEKPTTVRPAVGDRALSPTL